MPIGKDHRPPELLVPKDKSSDMLLRIVSPIAPQFVSHDMRHTLRLSESIRHQQNTLIALAQSGKKETADDVFSADSLAAYHTPGSCSTSSTNSEKRRESEGVREKTEKATLEAQGEAAAGKSLLGADKETSLFGADKEQSPRVRSSAASETTQTPQDQGKAQAAEQPQPQEVDYPSPEDTELQRMTHAMGRKKLRRDNTPGPLRFLPRAQAAGMAPTINLAPMRHMGNYPVCRVPVRYVYGAVVPIPQTAVIPARRMVSDPRKRPARRQVVMDVFQNDSLRVAPMTSQPPLAQMTRFAENDGEDAPATPAEMEEMERKRERGREACRDELKGSIAFQNSAFNFTIYKAREHKAKENFMKICETTWDEYMARMT